jgi:hypothetical protein
MTGLFQDLRHALRQLRKSPRFTATAILMLGLGIGGNTSIFQLLTAIRLRTLPGARSTGTCRSDDQYESSCVGCRSHRWWKIAAR